MHREIYSGVSLYADVFDIVTVAMVGFGTSKAPSTLTTMTTTRKEEAKEKLQLKALPGSKEG